MPRTKTPLHLLTSRLKRLPLHHRIAHLRSLLKNELPFSVRRNELQSLLEGQMLKQLRKEIRKESA